MRKKTIILLFFFLLSSIFIYCEDKNKISVFDEYLNKEEDKNKGENKEQKKKKKGLIDKFFEHFGEKKPKQPKQPKTPSPPKKETVKIYHHYYDYYHPSYKYVPPPYDYKPVYKTTVEKEKERSFSEVLSDIELAFRIADADLLSLYTSDDGVLLELPDEEQQKFTKREFYERTYASFKDIKTKSFKFELIREISSSYGFAKGTHIYLSGVHQKKQEAKVSLYLEKDRSWCIKQIRFSPGVLSLPKSKIPQSYIYADNSQKEGSFAYHRGENKQEKLNLEGFGLSFGMYEYGGVNIGHYKIKSGEGINYQSLSTTDIMLKGQITKSVSKKASTCIFLGLKTLNFSLPENSSRRHKNLVGFGIGAGINIPIYNYFIGHGSISGSTFSGTSLLDYEFGVALRLHPKANLDISYRSLQIPFSTIGGTRYGIEIKF